MAGLGPAIHEILAAAVRLLVDARAKPGQDDLLHSELVGR